MKMCCVLHAESAKKYRKGRKGNYFSKRAQRVTENFLTYSIVRFEINNPIACLIINLHICSL